MIRGFLERYRANFYDYHQIILLKDFELPFTVVEHIEVDRVNTSSTIVKVVGIRRGVVTMEDYDSYANLIVYKALHHLARSERDEAVRELGKLEELFDGWGFADRYHQEHRVYETYKIALAAIAYKAVGNYSKAERYTEILYRIRPLTTLYTKEFKGVGDLNLETATLVAIALYQPVIQTTLRDVQLTQNTIPTALTVVGAIAVITIIAFYTYRKHFISKRFPSYFAELLFCYKFFKCLLEGLFYIFIED